MVVPRAMASLPIRGFVILSLMKARGGKILMYTGTDDQLVPAQDAINYYERVIMAMGGLKQTQDFSGFS